MSPEQQKAAFQRYIEEAWNRGVMDMLSILQQIRS